MDISQGSTAGRDRLRSRLRAPVSAISDTDMQYLWDQAVGACAPYIRPGYEVSSPEETISFVLAVAVHIFQATDAAPGDTLPDGTVVQPFAITSNMVKRYLVLGGATVTGVKIVGGGSHTAGVLTP